jgi:glutathione S-transferase
MPRYRLHCFGESGNAYKAALMLELSGCDWEPVFVDFFGGTTRDPAWREGTNEMGEAPVLEDGDLRLSQSGVILDHLAKATGRFGPRDEAEAREVWRWILFDNHKFTSYFATLRFLYGISKTGETPVTEWLRGRAKSAYGVVEKHLATRDFLLGGRPTIADLSLAGYVYYPEETGLDVDGLFPSVARWRERVRALPGWKHPYDLMPRKG